MLFICFAYLCSEKIRPSSKDMKNLLAILLFAVLAAACSGGGVRNEKEAEKCAVGFMEKFFSFNFSEAENLCTSDTRFWIIWYVSNITATDVDSIHRIPEAPKVELQSVEAETSDTTAIAYCQVENFYQLDSLGRHGRMVRKAVFRLPLAMECGEWRVRMEGPLQSER